MSGSVQNFKNHARMRPVYHYFMAPLSLFLTGWAAWNVFQTGSAQDWFFFLLAFSTVFSLNMPRRFAIENQDRIIRLEMRYRYYLLTGKRLEPMENELGLRRIIALRFASDAELPGLVETTLAENLTVRQIKQRVTDWQGDFNRV